MGGLKRGFRQGPLRRGLPGGQEEASGSFGLGTGQAVLHVARTVRASDRARLALIPRRLEDMEIARQTRGSWLRGRGASGGKQQDWKQGWGSTQGRLLRRHGGMPEENAGELAASNALARRGCAGPKEEGAGPFGPAPSLFLVRGPAD